VSDGREVQLPWERIIEALPLFIPEDTVLVCSDPEIIAAWEDREVDFSPADPKLGLPEGARVATMPAWRFAGRRKPPESLPAAVGQLSVAIIS
jgi:hypothetical protein